MTWLSDRQRDGGIDQVPLPEGVAGQLWLCGKHAIAPERFSEPDHPWETVVCLCERHELIDRYPEYTRWLSTEGSRAVWWPIPDLHAPTVGAMREFVAELADRLRTGDRLLVHCAAGIGRTGTTAVCVLMALGLTLADAERVVADARPMAGPETGAQRTLVDALALPT